MFTKILASAIIALVGMGFLGQLIESKGAEVAGLISSSSSQNTSAPTSNIFGAIGAGLFTGEMPSITSPQTEYGN